MDLSQLFALVANQLAKDNIPFQTEWLKACLTYLHGEFNGKIPSDKDVYEMVYQQWLFSDLRDFGVVSLPRKLPEKAHEILHGICYINSVLDVSRSLYSQHQNLLGSKIDIEERDREAILAKKSDSSPGTIFLQLSMLCQKQIRKIHMFSLSVVVPLLSHQFTSMAVFNLGTVFLNYFIETSIAFLLLDANYLYSTDPQNNLNEYWTEEFTHQNDAEVQPLMYEKVSISAEEGLLETSQRLAVIELGTRKNITVESNVTNGIHISFDNQLATTSVRLLADLPTERAGKYLIRGIILTTIGRLDPNRGSHWSLDVKVNDGSAAMDMKMNEDLLTRLIGISSKKAWDIKTGAIIDSVQRNLAGEALKKCGKFLRDFDGALEVVFTGLNEMPIICRLLSVASFEDVVQ
ncbi:hypothetical protein D918_09590 [Trichuris suis]|nr:hypothetical protein D918_09590 [Trichuris suis]